MKAILGTLAAILMMSSASAENCISKIPAYQICADQGPIFSEAVAKSQREGKPLLVIFGADWCAYCKNMDRLLSDAKIAARVSAQLNWIEIASDKKTPAGASADQIFRELNEMAGDGKIEKIPGFPFLAFYNPITKKVIWSDSEKFETDDDTQKKGVLHDPELMIQTFSEAVRAVGN